MNYSNIRFRNLQQQKFNQAVSHAHLQSQISLNLQQQKFNEAVSQATLRPRLPSDLQQQKFNQAVSLGSRAEKLELIYNSRNSIRRLAKFLSEYDSNYLQQQKFNQAVSLTFAQNKGVIIYNSRNSIRRLAGLSFPALNCLSTIVEIQLGGQPSRRERIGLLQIYNSRNSIRRLARKAQSGKRAVSTIVEIQLGGQPRVRNCPPVGYLQQQKFNQAVSHICLYAQHLVIYNSRNSIRRLA